MASEVLLAERAEAATDKRQGERSECRPIAP